MLALVGNFIVYIVRLKPLMYLYYVRYYKPSILVSRHKDKNYFSFSNGLFALFNKKLLKPFVPLKVVTATSMPFTIAHLPYVATLKSKFPCRSLT